MSTIVELHVCLIYYTGILASLYSHSHTINSIISHQPIATIWGSPRSFYHHVGGSASMIPRSGAAAADWWIWPIRSAFRSFDNGRNIRYLTTDSWRCSEGPKIQASSIGTPLKDEPPCSSYSDLKSVLVQLGTSPLRKMIQF